MNSNDGIYTARYWKKRTDEAFLDWVNEQPVTWAVTTFSCYTVKFRKSNKDVSEQINIESVQANSRHKSMSIKPVEGFINDAMKPTVNDAKKLTLMDSIKEASSAKRKRYPCTIKSIENGFGEAVMALDQKYLKGSQRRKGIKLLRVPYLGGDRTNGIPYHIHSLIELPQNVQIDDFGSYLDNVFQKVMERELKSKERFVAKAKVWCKPYQINNESFLKYCGRFEGATLAVGLEKVVFPHLIMNPPLVGAL